MTNPKNTALPKMKKTANPPAASLPVSIVLAACNGEEYLPMQLDSIVFQMKEGDELLIGIDPSDDRTRDLTAMFVHMHPETDIQIFDGPGKGLIANFEMLLSKVKNEIIVTSDQDDVWLKGKLDLFRKGFDDSSVMAMIHDAKIVDENLSVIEPSFFKAHGTKTGYMNNLVRNSMIGCCMAVRKCVVDASLPFPEIPMHDQFLGLQAYRMGEVLFKDEALVLYRRHSSNASSMTHAPLKQQISWRMQLLKALKARPAKASIAKKADAGK